MNRQHTGSMSSNAHAEHQSLLDSICHECQTRRRNVKTIKPSLASCLIYTLKLHSSFLLRKHFKAESMQTWGVKDQARHQLAFWQSESQGTCPGTRTEDSDSGPGGWRLWAEIEISVVSAISQQLRLTQADSIKWGSEVKRCFQ